MVGLGLGNEERGTGNEDRLSTGAGNVYEIMTSTVLAHTANTSRDKLRSIWKGRF